MSDMLLPRYTAASCGVLALAISMFVTAEGQPPTSFGPAAKFDPAQAVSLPVTQGRSAPSAATPQPNQTTPPPYPEMGQAGQVIAFSTLLENQQHQIVVIDAEKNVMKVYRVPPDNGAISLVSVRNIGLDSSIDFFNSGDPSPEDIRKMQQLNR